MRLRRIGRDCRSVNREEIQSALACEDPLKVCHALRFLASPRATGGFPRRRVLELTQPPHPDRVREHAFACLVRKGLHPLETAPLRALLEESSPQLRRRLVAKVLELAFPSIVEEVVSWAWERKPRAEERAQLIKLLQGLPPQVVQRFLKRNQVFEEKDPQILASALGLLGRKRLPGSRPLLGQVLGHSHPRLRTTALEQLYPTWKKHTQAKVLRHFLQDHHHRPRSTAAVLGFPDHPQESLRALADLARSNVPLRRSAAAWGLGALVHTGHRGVDKLLRALSQDSDPLVAQKALAGLSRAGS